MSEPNPSLEKFLFEAALGKSSETERAAFLDGLCRGNPLLRARLDLLLEGQFQAEGFLSERPRKVDEPPAPPATKDEAASTFIGRYKLLEKIGEGGFGEVWMAEQKEPVKRRVALKIIKLGMDTKQVVARFEAERQALAMMDHPNIAKVLDAGATDSGRPYFVMELVRGIRITEYCAANRLPTLERLKLFIQVCHAIQHAHQKGIIHRDIKPSNILVTLNDPDLTGVPKVIDFGIAKATQIELTEKTLFTQFHQFLGTPAYVSPEQAAMTSLDIDTRSDIYSLGVLLYELLTGSTPFDTQELLKAGLEGMRRIICEKQPPRPSTRLTQQIAPKHNDGSGESKIKNQPVLRSRTAEGGKSKISTDLDWIVMKCLEKDRARRYETANGLARDVERHLNNEPVLARPPSRLYEFQKTVRRHWVGFSAVGAIVAALSIGVVISSLEAIRARQAEREQATQRRRAEQGEERGNRLFYAGKMSMVQTAWEQNRIAQVRQLLEETADYPDRGFEWYYWQRQTHRELKTLRGHLEGVNAAVFSPDGRRIVTGGADKAANVWDATSGSLLFTLTGHLDSISDVAFSPDGKRIASGSRDATARIWDAATGKPLLSLEGHGARIWSVDFSPDNRRVLTASDDGTAKIWDATSGRLLLTFSGPSGRVNCARFSPDGRRAVSGGEDQIVRVWDASTCTQLLNLSGHVDAITWVAYSPDGRLIASGSDPRDPNVRVWDAESGNKLRVLSGHAGVVNMVKFSSDSRRIVTASGDQTAKVWEAATGNELFTIKGHADALSGASFSPDGLWLVTASDDHTARIWDATGSREALTFTAEQDHMVMSAAFSPNGQRIVTGGLDQTARIWDAVSGRQLLILRGHNGPIQCVVFFADGRRIATGDDVSVKIWDAGTGTLLFVIEGPSGSVSRLALSPDGRRIVTAGVDGTARLWDVASGRPQGIFTGHTKGVVCVAFSPDGRRIATASDDQTAKVWDVASGKASLTLKGHSAPIQFVTFSPDGQRILTASYDRTARVWDAFTGESLLTLRGHSAAVGSVAYSPDGHRLLTGSFDQTVKMWDAVTGVELLTLKGHRGRVHPVGFSPDGQRILTGSDDGTARLWDAATPDQVAAWQAEKNLVEAQQAALAKEKAAADEQARALTARDPGAISQWLVLGPLVFDGYSGAKALAQQQIEDEAQLRPSADQHSWVAGSDWPWRSVQLDTYRMTALHLFRWNGPRNLAYLACYIVSETDQTNLLIKVGSQDQSKVYLNGKEIYLHDKPRTFVLDQDVVTGITLKAGANVVVFKVADEDGFWRASLRFTDAAGQPVKGIRVTLTPP